MVELVIEPMAAYKDLHLINIWFIQQSGYLGHGKREGLLNFQKYQHAFYIEDNIFLFSFGISGSRIISIPVHLGLKRWHEQNVDLKGNLIHHISVDCVITIFYNLLHWGYPDIQR